MAEVKDTPGDAIDAFTGTETDDQAEYALRDFHAKDIAIAAANRAGGGSPGGGIAPTSWFVLAVQEPAGRNDFETVNAAVNGWRSRSSNGNGAWIEWELGLAAGEYALSLSILTYNAAGILVWSLDDGDGAVNIDQAPYSASGASNDTYSADVTDFVYANVATDITIPADGYYTLRATVTGKNASSSAFDAVLYWTQMTKVGA